MFVSLAVFVCLSVCVSECLCPSAFLFVELSVSLCICFPITSSCPFITLLLVCFRSFLPSSVLSLPPLSPHLSLLSIFFFFSFFLPFKKSIFLSSLIFLIKCHAFSLSECHHRTLSVTTTTTEFHAMSSLCFTFHSGPDCTRTGSLNPS